MLVSLLLLHRAWQGGSPGYPVDRTLLICVRSGENIIAKPEVHRMIVETRPPESCKPAELATSVAMQCWLRRARSLVEAGLLALVNFCSRQTTRDLHVSGKSAKARAAVCRGCQILCGESDLRRSVSDARRVDTVEPQTKACSRAQAKQERVVKLRVTARCRGLIYGHPSEGFRFDYRPRGHCSRWKLGSQCTSLALRRKHRSHVQSNGLTRQEHQIFERKANACIAKA